VEKLSSEQRHLLYLFSKEYLSELDRSELKEAIKAVKNLSDTALDWWNKFTGPIGFAVNALLNKIGAGRCRDKEV
jgi:translation elongation factor EF-1beta